jgi:hypothetical protein
MSEKSHWPFGSDAGAQGARDVSARDAAAERERAANQAALSQRARHDRLIVGGRAHAKKHGLS